MTRIRRTRVACVVCGSGLALWLALGTGRPGFAAPAEDSERSRCRISGDLVACGAALGMRPNDPDLLVAEADALVRAMRPGEAIGVYRHALRNGAPAAELAAKIEAAQAQRRERLSECEREAGAAGERACEAAWLPGAPDELQVFKRRGLLLEQLGRSEASLDAYMAAARLAPRDRAVARSVITATDASSRSDAAILGARASALLLLGRPGEASAVLRRALRLEPNSPLLRERLRAAERAQPRRAIPAAPAAASSEGPALRFSNEAPVTRSN